MSAGGMYQGRVACARSTYGIPLRKKASGEGKRKLWGVCRASEQGGVTSDGRRHAGGRGCVVGWHMKEAMTALIITCKRSHPPQHASVRGRSASASCSDRVAVEAGHGAMQACYAPHVGTLV